LSTSSSRVALVVEQLLAAAVGLVGLEQVQDYL
jgi:hypothetical protein